MQIDGNGFGTGGVEIRWGSENGQKLGQTHGPSFSVPVTIPDASPGVYYVLAISQTLTGGQGNVVARDSFEVTPAKARPPVQNTPNTLSDSSNSGSSEDSSNSGSSEGPASSAPQRTAPEAPEVARSQPASDQKPSLGSTTTAAGSGARPLDRNAGALQAGGPDGEGPSVGGPSGPPQGPGKGSQPVGDVDPLAVDMPRSLTRTVSPDLWSGFERATLSPGLLEPAEQPSSRQRDLFVGISILGAGVVTLLGGLLLGLDGRRLRGLGK